LLIGTEYSGVSKTLCIYFRELHRSNLDRAAAYYEIFVVFLSLSMQMSGQCHETVQCNFPEVTIPPLLICETDLVMSCFHPPALMGTDNQFHGTVPIKAIGVPCMLAPRYLVPFIPTMLKQVQESQLLAVDISRTNGLSSYL
jgi:hypothetical protein